MANIIRIKRRLDEVGALSGAPPSLLNAELAFNEVDNTLYYGRGDDGSGTASMRRRMPLPPRACASLGHAEAQRNTAPLSFAGSGSAGVAKRGKHSEHKRRAYSRELEQHQCGSGRSKECRP